MVRVRCVVCAIEEELTLARANTSVWETSWGNGLLGIWLIILEDFIKMKRKETIQLEGILTRWPGQVHWLKSLAGAEKTRPTLT